MAAESNKMLRDQGKVPQLLGAGAGAGVLTETLVLGVALDAGDRRRLDIQPDERIVAIVPAMIKAGRIEARSF